MDILQVALIFLIILLAMLLSITGFYVFLILKDLKKALDKLNKVLQAGEEIAVSVEKPMVAAAELVTALGNGAKAITKVASQSQKSKITPASRRFFKKSR